MFRVQRATPKDPILGHAGKKQNSMEHFWLCPKCAGSMTVAIDRRRNVKVISMPQVRRAAAS